MLSCISAYHHYTAENRAEYNACCGVSRWSHAFESVSGWKKPSVAALNKRIELARDYANEVQGWTVGPVDTSDFFVNFSYRGFINRFASFNC
jgi:hypothetical protein